MSDTTSDRAMQPMARALAAEAGLSDHVVRPLDRGLSSDLFTTHSAPEGPPAAVVKLQRGQRAKVYAESAALESLAASSNLSVPRVLLTSPEHRPPALVLSWLEDGSTTLEELGTPVDSSTAAAFGEWVARLHETAPVGESVKMTTDPLSLSERVRHQARNAVDRAGATHPHAPLLSESLGWLERELDRHADLGCSRRMIHRDLRPHNIVLDADGQFVGVVDFEHAAAADPAWDFAKLQWWCFDRIPRLLAPFTEGYTRVRPLPSHSKRRLFRVFEATTLLAYFTGKQATYEREARRQLESELCDAQRPRWSGSW